MFGRKKKDLPAGARMMHYEGLRGFSQDGPCFMERTEAGLVFRQTNGPAATLPLEKVTGLEMMPERNFMARYHGTAATTASATSRCSRRGGSAAAIRGAIRPSSARTTCNRRRPRSASDRR